MPLPLVVTELAKADIRGAYRWYDEQRPGLGDEFVANLDETLNRIAARPERFAVAAGDVRYLALTRFLTLPTIESRQTA
jgi:plasmid stabilization system protein ParE